MSHEIDQPTADDIIEEGMIRAGQAHRVGPKALQRGRLMWLPELMADMIGHIRNNSGDGTFKSLHTTSLMITRPHESRYALPADFDEDVSAALLDGVRGITDTGSTATTIELASDNSVSEADLKGREILLTSGDGKGQIRQVTALSGTTATVSEQWTKAPVNGDTYLIVNETYELCQEQVYDEPDHFGDAGSQRPNAFFLFNEEMILDQSPDLVYGIRLRYYAEPSRIDYDDPKWDRLLRRFRRPLTMGCQMLALEDIDDNRAEKIRAAYYSTVVPAVADRELTTGDEPDGFVLGD